MAFCLAAVGNAAAESPPLAVLAMPGEVHRGPLPPLTDVERDLARALEADVRRLAGEIGERNATALRMESLLAAETFLARALTAAGYAPQRQAYEVRGRTVANLVAEVPGAARGDEILVVGGHYDSAVGTPGANDNASGAAATLALARAFAARKPARTVRFAFFVNEEPPWFQTEDMGSLRYARRCRERKENVVGMISLETVGYYSDEKGSQKFDSCPPLRLIYPDTGNFVAFVADTKSAALTRRIVGSFRGGTKFPAHGCCLPDVIDGVGWSDHWSFWQAGYPAVMVTDTAPFRYPHYHAAEDTPDKLDYERLARVVAGLERVIVELADAADAILHQDVIPGGAPRSSDSP
jgi:Zn-dependent M28 family amino/carboxypeptidase